MKHSKIDIDLRKPQVMAILNITPDSFYGASRSFNTDDIESRIRSIVAEGATIIDIGGYSSRPNADDVSADEEWRRIDLGLSALRRVAPDVIVSLDTFRSSVAERAIEKYGALIINDISAGELDPKLIDIAAAYQVPYIAMHMRGTPQTMQDQTNYKCVVDDVVDYFADKVKELKNKDIDEIILDPGFGFAKTLDQNYTLMRSLHRLCDLGYPVLVGVSRKSMIYNVLSATPAEALTGTVVLNWEALRQGATILRVHDVREAVESVKIYTKFMDYDKGY